MRVEQQVCTLEQAKRLKELGIEGPSLFAWAHDVANCHPSFNGETTEWETEYAEEPTLMDWSMACFDGLPYYHAYTVAELGLALGEYRPTYDNDDPKWTEAQSRGAALIYLLENNIITASQVNARLEGKEEGFTGN